MSKVWNQCDECGRFVGYSDMRKDPSLVIVRRVSKFPPLEGEEDITEVICLACKEENNAVDN